jgi:hypothetical protein
MDFGKMFQKGFMGAFTALVVSAGSIVASNPSIITNLIPAKYGQMTVASLLGFILVAGANWLKNKNVPAGEPQK